MAGFSQFLAILMSMLRVWLEYAWKQPRVWLEYAYSMPTVCLETKNLFPYGEQNIPTLGTKHSQPGNKTGFLRPFSSKRAELERRLLVSLLFMLVLGSGSVCGQETPDYSGTYYIKSVSTNKETTGDYYLCPTEGWAFFVSDETNPGTVQGDDNGKPFLTTYHCKNGSYDATKAVWNIEKGPESGFYYIKQTKTGRYMVSNGPICSNANRARVHLEEINNPEDLDDKALFKIYLYNNEYLVIQPKGITTGSYKWLTVNQGNKDDLAGTNAKTDGPSGFENTGGIICIYSENDANAKFYLEKAKCKTPVITFDNVTSKVTITSDNDETIYYTTDGNNPDANFNVYSEPFVLNAGAVIKAISKKDGIIDSEIATLTVVKLATPTISFNEETREVTITAAEGAVIFYTTNDTYPTIEETTAHAASPVVIAHALPSTKIHARAVKSGSINSDVVTRTDIPAKVLTNPTIILAEDEFVYDGSAKEPAITVKDGDVVVSADEYVVTYSNNTNAGTASVTISDNADGDYQVNDGSKNFTISPKSLGDDTTAAEGITVEMTEDGSLSAVKDGSTTLVENTDYTQETVEEGSDKIITITGIGNYTGIVKGIYASPQFDDPDGDGGGQAAAVYLAKRDLSCPTGIIPYIIRKVNPSIGTAVITPLDYIPVDVPVLLLSDAEASGFVASPKDPSTSEVTAQTKNSNLLKVSSGGETVGAAQIYMFYKGEFVLAKAGTLSEGKFYLYNPNYTNTPTSENSGNSETQGALQFIIDDEDTTGITEFENSTIKEQDTDVWYTLDGRRLSVRPSKAGIYIHQGQKEFIKRK